MRRGGGCESEPRTPEPDIRTCVMDRFSSASCNGSCITPTAQSVTATTWHDAVSSRIGKTESFSCRRRHGRVSVPRQVLPDPWLASAHLERNWVEVQQSMK